MKKSVLTLEERIDRIAEILGKTPDEVKKVLSLPELGVQSIGDVAYINEGHWRHAIGCDEADVTKRVSRVQGGKTWAILSGKSVEQSDDGINALQSLGIDVKLGIKDLTSEQLVSAFDPFNQSCRIFRELKARFGSATVLVFNPGTKELNKVETVIQMKRIERGLNPLSVVEVNGNLVRTLAIGDAPDQFIEEDPLFIGVPLENGKSTENWIDWSSVPMPARQFCRIMLERGAINPRDEAALKSFTDTLEHGLPALQKVYKSVALAFSEREAEDTLPKLRVKSGSTKKQHPFAVNRSY